MLPPFRRLRSPALLVAAWSAAAYALRVNDLVAKARPGYTSLSPLLAALPSALLAGAFLWTVLRITRSERRGRGMARVLAAHAAAAVALAVASTLAIRAVDREFGVDLHADVGRQVLARVIGYLLLAGTAHALAYARRYGVKEMEELRLHAALYEADLSRTRAELRALKLELNPHFLFNALHTVSALMHDDPARARGVLASFSDLLQRALDRAGEHEVSLEEEIAFLRSYLQIEQARLGPGLRVEWEVDGEALDAAVPHLLLQPLVENALKHGIAPRGEGTLRIGAACQGERLQVWVQDDGAGPPETDGPRRHRGVGVANVRGRLEQLYGDDARFTLAPAPGGGTRADAFLPLHAPGPASRDRGVPGAASPDAPPAPAVSSDGRIPRSSAAGRAVRRGSTLVRGAGWALLFVTVGALFLKVTSEYHHADGRVVEPWVARVIAGYSAALWCAYGALALRISRTRPVERGRVVRRVALHLCVGAAMGVFTWAVYQAGSVVLHMARPVALLPNLLAVVVGHLLLYIPVAGTAHALEYARRVRGKEVEELRLRTRLWEADLSRTRAELRALKLELNPHFLFNALQTVAVLMADDVRRANAVLVSIGDLLRRALDWAGEQEVSLEEEVAFLRSYLQIEQARLGPGLRVEWEVDGEALDAAVPHLLLQPLVENALKHGIAPRGEGTLRIGAACQGERLRVWVQHDGAGPPEPDGGSPAGGAGVDGVRLRLEQLYGADARFTLAAAAGGGTRAEASIPLHAPAPAALAGAAAYGTSGDPHG